MKSSKHKDIYTRFENYCKNIEKYKKMKELGNNLASNYSHNIHTNYSENILKTTPLYYKNYTKYYNNYLLRTDNGSITAYPRLIYNNLLID